MSDSTTTQTVRVIQPHMFILFAEYLGYVSPFIEWAEEWYSDKANKFPEFKKKILTVEAQHIYNEILKDGLLTDAQNWYEKINELIFPDDLPY